MAALLAEACKGKTEQKRAEAAQVALKRKYDEAWLLRSLACACREEGVVVASWRAPPPLRFA